MSESVEAQIAAGQALDVDGNEEQAMAYFSQLAARYPDHALVQFEAGGVFDSAGREAEAAGYYRRAFAMGLPDDILPRIAVQFGSTLRNLGEYAEAVQMLSDASARFPDNHALRAFLALALFSAGRPGDALAEVLRMTVDTPGFYERYHRSLRAYADDLTNS